MEPERLSSARTRVGAGDCQEEKTPRSLISAQKCAHKTKKTQKIPRNRATLERIRRENHGEEEEARNWRHNPNQDHQGPDCRLRLLGGAGGGLRNGVGKTKPRREYK